MRDLNELKKLLQIVVFSLVKLHSENSILIRDNVVEIDFNYLNKRAYYYLIDNQLITLEEFDLLKQSLFKYN